MIPPEIRRLQQVVADIERGRLSGLRARQFLSQALEDARRFMAQDPSPDTNGLMPKAQPQPQARPQQGGSVDIPPFEEELNSAIEYANNLVRLPVEARGFLDRIGKSFIRRIYGLLPRDRNWRDITLAEMTDAIRGVLPPDGDYRADFDRYVMRHDTAISLFNALIDTFIIMASETYFRIREGQLHRVNFGYEGMERFMDHVDDQDHVHNLMLAFDVRHAFETYAVFYLYSILPDPEEEIGLDFPLVIG